MSFKKHYNIVINFTIFLSLITLLLLNSNLKISNAESKIDYSTFKLPFYKEYGDWIVRSIDNNFNGYVNQPNNGWHEMKTRYYGGAHAYGALDYVPINFEKNQHKSNYVMPIASPVTGTVVDFHPAGDFCGEAWLTIKDENGNHFSLAHIDGGSMNIRINDKVNQGQYLGNLSKTCNGVTHMHVSFPINGYYRNSDGKLAPIYDNFKVGSTEINDNAIYHGAKVFPALSIKDNGVSEPSFNPTFHNDGLYKFDDEGNVIEKIRDRTEDEKLDFNNLREYDPESTTNENTENRPQNQIEIKDEIDPVIPTVEIKDNGLISISWDSNHYHEAYVLNNLNESPVFKTNGYTTSSPIEFELKDKYDGKKGTLFIKFWTWDSNYRVWRSMIVTNNYDFTDAEIENFKPTTPNYEIDDETGILTVTWSGNKYQSISIDDKNFGGSSIHRTTQSFKNSSPIKIDLNDKVGDTKGTAYIRFWTWNTVAQRWGWEDETIDYDFTKLKSEIEPIVPNILINMNGELNISWNESLKNFHYITIGKSIGDNSIYKSVSAVTESPVQIDLTEKLGNSDERLYIRFYTWDENNGIWVYKDMPIEYRFSDINTDEKTELSNDDTTYNITFKEDQGWMRNKPAYISGSKVLKKSRSGQSVNVIGIDKNRYWLKYYNPEDGKSYWSASWLFSISNDELSKLQVVQ